MLGLSGSLRAASVHTALLHAAAQTAPDGVTMELFDGLADLPHFNPDIEEQEIAAVSAFRAALNTADAVLIACPEYAHGLPGAFKNALDWVVGCGEMSEKPVLTLNASARSIHAPAQLAEVLRTMGARVLEGVLIEVPRQARDVLDVPGVAEALQEMWRSLFQTASGADALA
ncbi:NADPH-dependent FMN reductase [Deinococcus sp. AJ005]|uniref:NADPH-dependent FMN reductase n=1 Tax=Deinococcus sp. AJ005 TaxID=2652443 RepID=UPI001865744B|nr:NADPH-dependent FMN reductase [Deinococcus sp. AJ005]